MRTRGAQKATTEMGRMGDEDPVTGTSRSARRYARAVFELAQGERDVEAWTQRLAQLREILEVLRDQRDALGKSSERIRSFGVNAPLKTLIQHVDDKAQELSAVEFVK